MTRLFSKEELGEILRNACHPEPVDGSWFDRLTMTCPISIPLYKGGLERDNIRKSMTLIFYLLFLQCHKLNVGQA